MSTLRVDRGSVEDPARDRGYGLVGFPPGSMGEFAAKRARSSASIFE